MSTKISIIFIRRISKIYYLAQKHGSFKLNSIYMANIRSFKVNFIKKVTSCILLLHFLSFTPSFAQQNLFKWVFDNGLTLIVKKTDSLQDVSIQLWYNVGSKHESSSQKGLAHLIEHMIFKGTEQLSEPDINIISHILSAYSNAATSYDWTHYLFNVPIHNWKHILPIMADCMRNCTFKEDILNAELKVVIQELKMRRDNYINTMFHNIMSNAFPDHPYHYPVIGFKQDLWNLKQENLYNFYKTHYTPNNATLVVVGNIEPEAVYEQAQELFGSITCEQQTEQPEFYFNQDIAAQNSVIYRDIQNSQAACAFIIPGLKDERHYLTNLLEALLTGGKESRLHKKLVDTKKLVHYIQSQSVGLFDQDLYIILYEPHNKNEIKKINNIILKELQKLSQKIHLSELERASRQYLASQYNFLQSNYAQASAIGKTYLATGDEKYIYKQLEKLKQSVELKEELQQFVKEFFRRSIMHQAVVHPIPNEEKDSWKKLQETAEQEDARILLGRIRESDLESPKLAPYIKPAEPCIDDVAQPKVFYLKNGLKVLTYHTNAVPTITIQLNLKGDATYEPDNLEGIYSVMQYLMAEGTKNYPNKTLAKEIEQRGMSLDIHDGIEINLLSEDFEKALEFLKELTQECTLPKKALEKVKLWAHADIDNFYDNPSSIASKLASEYTYEGHPYANTHIGTHKTIDAIDRTDIKKLYKKIYTAHEATLVIVGDIKRYSVEKLLKKYLGDWRNTKLKPLNYPKLVSKPATTISKHMDRDQIVLLFTGLSVERTHPDYEKLVIFNEILSGGMDSRLFELREKSGAFYGISGSTTAGSDQQPGICIIKTKVSPDREKEAINMIRDCIEHVIETITPEDIAKAKRTRLCAPANIYSTNKSIASVFSNLNEYNLPFTYFVQLKEKLDTISVDDVKEAARKILQNDRLSLVRVGRVSE